MLDQVKSSTPSIEGHGPAPSRRFRNWVRVFGVSALARELQTHRTVVHGWLNVTGRRHAPRLGTAARVLQLSYHHERSPGRLTWSDLYGKPWDESTGQH